MHQGLKESLQVEILAQLHSEGVELRLTKNLAALAKKKSLPFKLATERDWYREYNDLIINVKDVASADEAIIHIKLRLASY